MTTYAVTYVYADDAAGLDAHRAEHRAFLRGLHEAGVLRASGPQPAVVPRDGAPPAGAGALLVLEGDSAGDVLAALDEDPFRKVGLITERSAREWNVVIGGFA
ncbi:YciI family protein [Myceligenerans crystallogenes]